MRAQAHRQRPPSAERTAVLRRVLARRARTCSTSRQCRLTFADELQLLCSSKNMPAAGTVICGLLAAGSVVGKAAVVGAFSTPSDGQTCLFLLGSGAIARCDGCCAPPTTTPTAGHLCTRPRARRCTAELRTVATRITHSLDFVDPVSGRWCGAAARTRGRRTAAQRCAHSFTADTGAERARPQLLAHCPGRHTRFLLLFVLDVPPCTCRWRQERALPHVRPRKPPHWYTAVWPEPYGHAGTQGSGHNTPRTGPC